MSRKENKKTKKKPKKEEKATDSTSLELVIDVPSTVDAEALISEMEDLPLAPSIMTLGPPKEDKIIQLLVVSDFLHALTESGCVWYLTNDSGWKRLPVIPGN